MRSEISAPSTHPTGSRIVDRNPSVTIIGSGILPSLAMATITPAGELFDDKDRPYSDCVLGLLPPIAPVGGRSDSPWFWVRAALTVGDDDMVAHVPAVNASQGWDPASSLVDDLGYAQAGTAGALHHRSLLHGCKLWEHLVTRVSRLYRVHHHVMDHGHDVHRRNPQHSPKGREIGGRPPPTPRAGLEKNAQLPDPLPAASYFFLFLAHSPRMSPFTP
ncbi:MAG: hypothetical protein CAF41_006140 [Nitrospira sp. CG24A]|nr:MAG: hypothetical protein CAF41_006140 [Nitrospira sp. CG24A]